MGIFKKKEDQLPKEAKAALTESAKSEDGKAAAAKEEGKPLEFKRAGERKFTSIREDRILRKPLVTEKAIVSGRYVFEVASDANKIDIKKAFFNLYGIEPASVHTARQKGKQVRFGRRAGIRKDWKKAIITLQKGQKIETL